MQLLLNIMFKGLNFFFSKIGLLTAPDWLIDLSVAIAKYIAIANWYFPIDTLCSVALTVVSVVGILMIISALLQLF